MRLCWTAVCLLAAVMDSLPRTCAAKTTGLAKDKIVVHLLGDPTNIVETGEVPIRHTMARSIQKFTGGLRTFLLARRTSWKAMAQWERRLVTETAKAIHEQSFEDDALYNALSVGLKLLGVMPNNEGEAPSTPTTPRTFGYEELQCREQDKELFQHYASSTNALVAYLVDLGRQLQSIAAPPHDLDWYLSEFLRIVQLTDDCIRVSVEVSVAVCRESRFEYEDLLTGEAKNLKIDDSLASHFDRLESLKVMLEGMTRLSNRLDEYLTELEHEDQNVDEERARLVRLDKQLLLVIARLGRSLGIDPFQLAT